MLKRTKSEDIIYKKLMEKETPLKRIRAKCLDCCCYQRNEVKLCPSTDCPLWIFRFGRNPHRKGKGGNSQNFRKNQIDSDEE